MGKKCPQNLVKACLLTVKKRRQEKLLFSYQEAVESKSVGKKCPLINLSSFSYQEAVESLLVLLSRAVENVGESAHVGKKFAHIINK